MSKLQEAVLNGLAEDEASNHVETEKEETLDQATGQSNKEEVQKEATEGKQPYTLEELQDIIENDKPIDVSRLSPEGVAIMKSFQRGFTPKLQEAALAKKELERIKQELEQLKARTKTPEDIVKEEFEKNPKETIVKINEAISDLQIKAAEANINGEDEEYNQIRKKIVALENLKDDLIISSTKQRDTEFEARKTKAIEAFNMAVAEAPIIKTKENEIYDFAINELKYSQDNLIRLLDPIINGVDGAAKNLVLLAKAYESAQANKKAKNIVPTPNSVIPSGSGEMAESGSVTREKRLKEYREMLKKVEEGSLDLETALLFRKKYNL